MMPRYFYRALDVHGRPFSGDLEASSEVAVVKYLQALGQFPLSTALSRPARDWLRTFLPVSRRQRELALATVELATLLRAGLELDRALAILQGLDEIKPIRGLISNWLDRVRGGASFSAALQTESSIPRIYVSLVRAGEHSGQLASAVHGVAEYMSSSQDLSDRIKSALMYPAILVVTAGLSITAILVFVLPQFEPLFSDAGKSLPLATQAVMRLGHFVQSFGWLIILLIACLVFGCRTLLRHGNIRLKYDSLCLRTPVFGPFLRKVECERFFRALGTLTLNGSPIPDAVLVANDAVSNRAMNRSIAEIGRSLREGDSLAERLAKSGRFPQMAVDFVRIGEESGNLGDMLVRQSELYRKQVKRGLEQMLELLVPALTITLGLVIAGLIGSILLAILSVNDLAIQG